MEGEKPVENENAAGAEINNTDAAQVSHQTGAKLYSFLFIIQHFVLPEMFLVLAK